MSITVLIIMDGFGVREEIRGNAIASAGTPRLCALAKEYPYVTLGAAGMDVGLPEGQMGNSEVGHLNIGAGRVVYQELTRITKAIRDGEFQANPALTGVMDKAKASGTKLHLGTDRRWRRAQPYRPFARADRHGKIARSKRMLHTLLYGRPRRAAQKRAWLYCRA